jgi:CheY-like chemotaxis protein
MSLPIIWLLFQREAKLSIRESVADEDVFSFWNAKRFPALGTERRVLVMHADPAMQRSLTLLLRLKGFAARDATTLHDFRHTVRYWAPQAFILDTRLDNHRDYRLIRELSAGPQAGSRVFLAISNVPPEDDVAVLKQVGYDGHSRRPATLWPFIEFLHQFYAPHLSTQSEAIRRPA